MGSFFYGRKAFIQQTEDIEIYGLSGLSFVVAQGASGGDPAYGRLDKAAFYFTWRFGPGFTFRLHENFFFSIDDYLLLGIGGSGGIVANLSSVQIRYLF